MLRRESADTQEHESCQLNDMDVEAYENEEKLRFIPSAVSSSAGWHEPNFSVTGNVGEKGFKYNDIASVMVKDHGEHKIDVCKHCHNLRHGEKKEPIVNSRLWKLLVAEKRSRGKLAAGLGGRGLEQKIIQEGGLFVREQGHATGQGFVCFVLETIRHRHDARHSHPCEDRRDAETAH